MHCRCDHGSMMADYVQCTAGLEAWFDAASEAVEDAEHLSSPHDLPLVHEGRAVQIFLGKSGADVLLNSQRPMFSHMWHH